MTKEQLEDGVRNRVRVQLKGVRVMCPKPGTVFLELAGVAHELTYSLNEEDPSAEMKELFSKVDAVLRGGY